MQSEVVERRALQARQVPVVVPVDLESSSSKSTTNSKDTMDDSTLQKIAQGILQAGGAAAILAALGKWFLSDYFKKADAVRELEKAAVESRITDLRTIAGDIKIEVMAMKERILHTEKVMIEATARLGYQSEKFEKLAKAFEGFVTTTGERLRLVESQSDQVIRIGQAMAARIKGSKNGSE
jgi:hypothetical protein